jgi:hypothetical protein
VWRGGSPKQRLWLGPGRYRSGRRDAGTNAKRFAHSCVKRYSLRRDDTNSDGNANSVDCRDADAYTYSYSNRYGYSDRNPYRDSNGYR